MFFLWPLAAVQRPVPACLWLDAALRRVDVHARHSDASWHRHTPTLHRSPLVAERARFQTALYCTILWFVIARLPQNARPTAKPFLLSSSSPCCYCCRIIPLPRPCCSHDRRRRLQYRPLIRGRKLWCSSAPCESHHRDLLQPRRGRRSCMASHVADRLARSCQPTPPPMPIRHLPTHASETSPYYPRPPSLSLHPSKRLHQPDSTDSQPTPPPDASCDDSQSMPPVMLPSTD